MPLRVDREEVDCALSLLRTYRQLEPIGKQSPEHDPQLTVGRSRRWPCNDVVTNGIGPLRTSQNPDSSAGFVVGPADRIPQRGVPHGEAARIGFDGASDSHPACGWVGFANR